MLDHFILTYNNQLSSSSVHSQWHTNGIARSILEDFWWFAIFWWFSIFEGLLSSSCKGEIVLGFLHIDGDVLIGLNSS
jgi:hypothetical protein